MYRVSNLCDYFVIASGTSLRQVNAIAQAITEDLDFLSVVAHIFYKPTREFYSLERLWSDAKKVRIKRGRASK